MAILETGCKTLLTPMSKAFTKESDAEDAEAERDEGPALPQGTRNYMTPQGAEKMRHELLNLLNVERPKVVETVAWAASNGDRSENADYIYGKRRLREIDRRIRFLTKRLDAVEIVDPATQKGDKVLFGATVEVLDEDGVKKTYRIVGIDESDPAHGKVSWHSPLGKALLQSKAGDAVTFQTPGGGQELEVLKVSFVAIEA